MSLLRLFSTRAASPTIFFTTSFSLFRAWEVGIFTGLIFGVWFSVGQARSFRRDSFQPSRGKKQEGKIKKSKIDLLVVLLRLGVRVAPLHDGLRVRLASRERAFVALLSDFIEGANELLSTKYSVLSTH